MICPICKEETEESFESNKFGDCCFGCFERGGKEEALDDMYAEMEMECYDNEENEYD